MPARISSIYLDYNATAPVIPEVLRAMQPYFSEVFGNSVSAAHSHGWDASEAVENARKKVAEFLSCESSEIYFTSGATESNNWCLRGLVDRWRKEQPGSPIHILASPLEHGSVTQVLKYLADYQQVEFDLLPVDSYGRVLVEEIPKLIRPSTKLICISWVQNEIGTVQPIAQIARLAETFQVGVLSDATQALGKVDIRMSELPVDYLSFSAHKLGGPKGVGFLFIRKSATKPVPLFYGGGHERGLRSATVNVPGVVGLGACAQWWLQNGRHEREKSQHLMNFFWEKLSSEFPGIHLNGSPLGPDRSPVNLNISFRGYRVPASIPGLSVSKSSACNSGVGTASYALKVIGVSDADADRTLRFSIGPGTSFDELVATLQILKRHISSQKADFDLKSVD